MTTEADELERELKRSARNRKIMLGAVIGAIVVLPLGKLMWHVYSVNKHNAEIEDRWDEQRREDEAYANRPLTADESARLRELAPKLADSVKQQHAAWAAAMSPAALDAIEPGEDACPVDVEHMSYELYDRGAPIPDDDFDASIRDADQIAARVAAGRLTRKDLEEAERLASPDGTVLIVVADEKHDPIVLGDTYDGGSIEGTAYVYRYAAQSVICAGHISAANTDSVDIHYTYTTMQGAPLDQELKRDEAARAALDRDLQVQVGRAMASSLHAVPVR